MYMKLLKLNIRARKDKIVFPFSESFTYIYGKAGAGKSTVVRLIAYCFGDDLTDTPTLQQEFLGVTLDVILGNNIVHLSRSRSDNAHVLVEWADLRTPSNSFQVSAPVVGETGKFILPDVDIENLSDMLFYLLDIKPPRVQRSKKDENSDLVRLSFKNIMWYWYLDQDNIDSSFFHLEERSSFHRNASMDVMRMVLGFYYEKVAGLEREFNTIQANRRGMESSVEQLSVFLHENGIEGTERINENIETLATEKSLTVQKKSLAIETKTYPKTHITDQLCQQIKSYASTINALENALADIAEQIEVKTQLSAQFLSTSIKNNNLNIAYGVLSDVAFNTCPQCGQVLSQRVVSEHTCYLCGQDFTLKAASTYDIIHQDLTARRKVIDSSIKRLVDKQVFLKRDLLKYKERKAELDEKLTVNSAEYDSLYLSSVKEYDIQLSEINAEIRYWEKVKGLAKQINTLHDKLDKLKIDEDNKKSELENARDEAMRQENRLKKLKDIFLDLLNRVKFPGIKPTDTILMDTKTFYPRILAKDNDTYEVGFVSLGSGGKKTIFKACFALALQLLLIDEKNIAFPNVLIIDTPMKNLSERENSDIFVSFYKLVYSLMQKELRNLQLIVIDKEYLEPPEGYEMNVLSKHMTPDDPNNPGLISYYLGGH